MIEVKVINKIGERLTQFKKEKGINKSWIASQMGITKQGLDRLCKSKNPTIETLELISHILECNIKELYDVEIYKWDDSELVAVNTEVYKK